MLAHLPLSAYTSYSINAKPVTIPKKKAAKQTEFTRSSSFNGVILYQFSVRTVKDLGPEFFEQRIMIDNEVITRETCIEL